MLVDGVWNWEYGLLHMDVCVVHVFLGIVHMYV